MRALAISFASLLFACSAGAPGPVSTPGATHVACMPLSVCTCSGGATCDVACGETECEAACTNGSTCGVIACDGRTSCHVSCDNGSTCRYVDCRGATGCDVACANGSRCNANCDGTTACASTCTNGSPCLLLCDGDAVDSSGVPLRPPFDARCRFTECSGGSGVVYCPNKILVCNRPCPTCGDGVCDRVAGETCANCSDCSSPTMPSGPC